MLLGFSLQLLQLDEGVHDDDVDLNGAVTPKYDGGHRRALFGKGVRQITPTTSAPWPHTVVSPH